MARTRLYQDKQIDSLQQASSFVPDPNAKKKRERSRSRSQERTARAHFDKCAREAHERLAAWKTDPNAWAGAKADHLLGLYVILHMHVYGVEPSDLLEGKTLMGATSCVRSLLRTEFLEDSRLLAEFIRWTWEQEKLTEKRFRERNEVRSFRMGWRVQFQSRSHLTSFRVALARKIAVGSR